MKKNKILKLFLLISFILAVAIIIAINFKMNTVKNIRYAIQKNFLGSDETESTTEKPTVNPDPNNIQVYMSCKSYLGSSKHHGKLVIYQIIQINGNWEKLSHVIG